MAKIGPVIRRKKPSRRKQHTREILIEFVSQGRFVKVIAIDPVSLIEVSIVGDARESQSRLEQTAVRKLQYVLLKRFGEAASEPQAAADRAKRKPGIIV